MKKIMLCIDLNNESLEVFKESFKKEQWGDVQEYHLVYSVQLQVYADTFFLTSFPDESQHKDIEASVQEVISNLKKEILPDANCKIKCLFSSSPKAAMAEYAKNNNIDEMVIGTRGKHGVAGVFSSSFAEYMVRHAPCQLRIIRKH